jgi:hypothetical protein
MLPNKKPSVVKFQANELPDLSSGEAPDSHRNRAGGVIYRAPFLCPFQFDASRFRYYYRDLPGLGTACLRVAALTPPNATLLAAKSAQSLPAPASRI